MTPLPRLTVAKILRHEPCKKRWPESRIRNVARTRARWTVAHVLRCRRIPPVDRIWVATRPGVTPLPQLKLWAVLCAERALRRKRRAGGECDPRFWEACWVARRYLAGQAPMQELQAAETAAWSVWAAGAGAWAVWAARSAVWAAWSAETAGAAAETAGAVAVAAAGAAWAAERRWQCRRLLRLLETGR